MRLIDPDDTCICESGLSWADCCARQLPLTLRYIPVRLINDDDAVRAGCGRGGHCCRNVHVPLTAFDVLRLSRLLEISTGEMLSQFAALNAEGLVEIDGDPECPFLVGNICSVYEQRPDSCRMYPFWRVSARDAEWLIERHTCAGCWADCRNETLSLARWMEGAAVEEGKAAEKLYQRAIQQLDDAGGSDELIEEFMAAVYDSDLAVADLPVISGSGEAAQSRYFQELVGTLQHLYMLRLKDSEARESGTAY